MAANAVDHQLTELEAFRYRFGRDQAARVVKLLKSLHAGSFPDSPSLIRFHEALLFLRAFPQGPSVVRVTERILNSFHKKVEALRKAGADMDNFDTLEVSGIAGTQMEDTLSFDVANWLINIRRMPGKVEIAWENYDPGRELGTIGPRFIPLLEDDGYVEADTPWRRWLEAAAGKKRVPAWLISRFEQLPLPAPQKAELYESLRVPLRWSLENSVISRTRNWKPVRSFFVHTTPLIRRSRVSLDAELARRPPRLTRLSRKQGEQVMDLIREVMLVPRTLRHDARRSAVGGAGRGRPRRDNLSLEPAASSPSLTARVCRGIDAEEWSTDQLYRSHRPLRVDGGWLQHVLHVPRRRSGMDLCASAALPVSPYGCDVRLGLSVSTGPWQRGSD
jgi:hypothetical protein